MPPHAPLRYSAAQKWLHWGTALLIMTLVVVGLT